MELWALKQYEETSTHRREQEIIGIFESKEDAMSHISDELPEWAEVWKTDESVFKFTNGVCLLVRYVTKIETGKIFDEYKQFKKHWSPDVDNWFPKLNEAFQLL